MISPKKGKIRKTLNNFWDVECYPIVIWTCENSTSVLKNTFEILTLQCFFTWKNEDTLSPSWKNQIVRERSLFTLSKLLKKLEHQHSKHAISVYLKKTNQRMKSIRHIPDTMAKAVNGLMLEWKVL